MASPLRFDALSSSRSPNFFELLGLPESFEIDSEDLQQRWKSAAAKVHPDRFASGTAAERRVAMQWSAQLNEAYRALRDPVSRARYLCEINGFPVGERTGGQLNPEFLEQQMVWRESLEEIRDSIGSGDVQSVALARDTLSRLSEQVEQARQACVSQVSRMIDAHCWPQAATALQQWMFVDKFKQEISRVHQTDS